MKIKIALIVLLVSGCLVGGFFVIKHFKPSWFSKKGTGTDIIKTDPTLDPNNQIPKLPNETDPNKIDKNFVIYKIASESITEGQIENEILKITPPDFETKMQSTPPNDVKVFRSRIRENAIKNLTTQAFIRLYLRDQKISITQADIDKTKKSMEDMMKKNFETNYPGQPFNLEKQLQEFGVSMETFMADITNQTMFEIATNPFLSKIDATTDSEAKDFFTKNKNKYLDPAKADMKHILLDSEGDADLVFDLLVKGNNFEETALKFSKDPQVKTNNGKIGWIPKNYMPDNMAKIIFDPTTKLFAPFKIQIKTQWYVIVVSGIQAEVTKTFEEAKEAAKEDCYQDKRMKALDDFFKKQEAKYGKPVIQNPNPKK